MAGRLVDAWGLPFVLGALIGALATVPLGALFALPAVRTRGINLAIVTLGLGTSLELMLFNNTDCDGRVRRHGRRRADAVRHRHQRRRHPFRYGLFCLAFFVVLALMVANMRRGRSGRRLIAVRTNERAAAALGISVPGAKLYAFALSAAIAAIGGMLLAFRKDTIVNYTNFDAFMSITAVAWAIIGGIGFLFGPVHRRHARPGRVRRPHLDASSAASTSYLTAHRRRHRDPARAAEPERRRQGVDRPAEVGRIKLSG